MRRAGIVETCIGIFILALLTAIAGGIYIEQSFFHTDFLGLFPQREGAGRRRSLASAGPAPVPAYLPGDLVPLGREETFGPGTLSDKIDGKADLYLSSGFVKLTVRRFSRKTDPKSWLELFSYEMKDSSGAFSVYSVQRRKDSKPVDLGPSAPGDNLVNPLTVSSRKSAGAQTGGGPPPGVSAYRTEDALFFTTGPMYFEIISASGGLAGDMTALAKNLVKERPRYAALQTESSLFPPESLDKSSISLQMKDVFAFSGLDRVYTAKYGAGNGRVTAFISKRKSPEEAAGLAAAYGRFLLGNGGTPDGKMRDVPGSKIYKVFDTYEIVLYRGKFLAGAHEADNLESAKNVASRIYRKLGEAVR